MIVGWRDSFDACSERSSRDANIFLGVRSCELTLEDFTAFDKKEVNVKMSLRP
jgi:hypothetical protein